MYKYLDVLRNRKMKAVILAGGEGIRLRPLTYYFNKCMLPLGSSQRPLIDIILTLLKKCGFKDVLFLTGYKEEQIKNYVGNGSRYGLNVSYLKDPENSFGSASALARAINLGYIPSDAHVLIYYGDILSCIRLDMLMAQHIESGAAATLVLSKGYEIPVGVASLDGRRIVKLKEKPKMDIYVTVGILSLYTGSLREILPQLNRAGLDIMKDMLPMLIDKGKDVEAFITEDEWYDIGSVERYEKLKPEIVDRLIERIESMSVSLKT